MTMSKISDQILRAAIARVVVGGFGGSIPSFRDRAISLHNAFKKNGEITE